MRERIERKLVRDEKKIVNIRRGEAHWGGEAIHVSWETMP